MMQLPTLKLTPAQRDEVMASYRINEDRERCEHLRCQECSDGGVTSQLEFIVILDAGDDQGNNRCLLFQCPTCKTQARELAFALMTESGKAETLAGPAPCPTCGEYDCPELHGEE